MNRRFVRFGVLIAPGEPTPGGVRPAGEPQTIWGGKNPSGNVPAKAGARPDVFLGERIIRAGGSAPRLSKPRQPLNRLDQRLRTLPPLTGGLIGR